ncbi:hypothetical protein EV667_4144 [Ancylobacter aquaticus]|uniref:Tripartite tricarboxylate transporter TctB family protein n=1 Tax=Ancylobacter aquaticus TaxID=100 RepID=A0A4R1HG32_ANCAQ|nr:hypothetical protein [Ancylobacter aquaticus]TCK19693.1 hypothetical protein EV667_4144 [Ancylobacter aquaticus]
MRIRNQHYVVDWLHLGFILLMVVSITLYLLNARHVSTSLNNLLLLQPLAFCALALCALIVPQCFRRADRPADADVLLEDDPLAPSLPQGGKELARVVVLGLALGLMIFSLNVVGFDVAISLFCIAAMAICGERRPVALIVYPLAVTLAAVYGFRALMSYPMVTFIL